MTRQTQTYLSQRMREAGIRPQLRHGQNFLIDLNLLDLLVRTADLRPSDVVLEIVHDDRHKRRERLEELLSDFSITHLRRAQALSLSGGERRRVEIARCLAADPSYLLLDEPFAGVDPISVGDIRMLVHDLKSRGIGVLITDHNVRDTLEIVDRAYILHDGAVLMSGTADEVVRDENVRRVYLITTGLAAALERLAIPPARVAGIDADGALLLDTQAGMRRLYSGTLRHGTRSPA